MTTELTTPEVTKGKRGRPAGSKNGPKVSGDIALKFDGQHLTANDGKAEFVSGQWLVGIYNAANAAAELEAAQTAVETLKATVAALKGLPANIKAEDYAGSVKGLSNDNAAAVLSYLFNR